MMGSPMFFSWVLVSSAMAVVLVCLILLIKALFRNKLGARWHYYIWFLLLLRLMVPYAPESVFSVFNLFNYAGHITNNMNIQYSTGDSVNILSLPSMPQTSLLTEADSVRNSGNTSPLNKSNSLSSSKLIYFIWLMGVVVLGLYIITLNLKFWLKIRNGCQTGNQNIMGILEDCKSIMGIHTSIPLIQTSEIRVPALFGFIHPRLLLPADIDKKLNHDELRYVILHELAHLKRKDIAVNWIMCIIQILHWFNPFIWYAFYRMRQDCEMACDALVLSHVKPEEHKNYGQTIINLLDGFSKPVRLPGIAGIIENKSQIKRRITMIALFKKRSYMWSALAIAVFILAGCAVLTSARNSSMEKTTDPEKTIDQKLDIIVSRPEVQMLSNPYEYIKASQKTYDEIVNMGQPALAYLLKKFENGSENGLKEWIMANACGDILGDKNPVKTWSSGREWYLGYTGKQLEDVNYYSGINDINKLFDAYSSKLDGAYAEGYGSSLVRLYNSGDTRTFVKKLSNYPKDKIDGISSLFAGELFIEGKQNIIKGFEKIKTEKSLTDNEKYVVDKILSNSKKLETERQDAVNSVSKKIEEIKKGYKDEKILSTQRFNGQYVLIESQKETFANKFDLYNLGTNQKDTLPTGIAYVTLQKIVSQNEFLFLANGRNSESNYADFPYIIRCVRGQEGKFKAVNENAYFKVNESTTFGSKEDEVLSNVFVNDNSIRAEFSPEQGKELAFYADYAIVPTAQTKYNRDKNQLIFEFKNSHIKDKFIENSRISIGNNSYINSLQIGQNSGSCIITLGLKDNVKEYTCKLKTTQPDGLGLPYVDIMLR